MEDIYSMTAEEAENMLAMLEKLRLSEKGDEQNRCLDRILTFLTVEQGGKYTDIQTEGWQGDEQNRCLDRILSFLTVEQGGKYTDIQTEGWQGDEQNRCLDRILSFLTVEQGGKYTDIQTYKQTDG